MYQYTMGSGQVAFYDFSMINEHYQCKGECGAAAAACWNGGFPNPKSCGVCICPSGYGGALCNMKPPGCGSTHTATSSFQTFVDFSGDGRPKSSDGFYRCNHWIEAPAGKKIEVRIKSYSGSRQIGCTAYAVEIKTQADQKRTGYRFCSRDDVGVSLISAHNYVPIPTYTIYPDTKAEIEYRFIDAPLPETSCPGTNTKNIWGCTVYYYFDASATAAVRDVFLRAADIWQAGSCITFLQSSTAPNRIRVHKGLDCSSRIGKIGGVQDLSLGEGCEKLAVALHELGHALGLTHTHSRVDRDNYITVIEKNILPEYLINFNKEYSGGMPYDYGSVMHYSQFMYNQTVNEPTIIAINSHYKYTMGSGQVGFYDLSMLNDLYQCKDKCGAAAAECWNGGFPNPKSCGVCVCPTGYGGALCNQRPPGCGAALFATTSYQTLVDYSGDGRSRSSDGFLRCNYHIQAPVGKKMEVRIKYFSGSRQIGCPIYGFEIKTQPDQKRTGYRFCSRDDAGQVLISTGDFAPIITYSQYNDTRAELEYRFIDAGPEIPVPYTFCADTHADCVNWAQKGFCTNAYYPIHQRMTSCGQSCYLC